MAIAEIMDDLNGPRSLGQWVLTPNILPLAAFLVPPAASGTASV